MDFKLLWFNIWQFDGNFWVIAASEDESPNDENLSPNYKAYMLW